VRVARIPNPMRLRGYLTNTEFCRRENREGEARGRLHADTMAINLVLL